MTNARTSVRGMALLAAAAMPSGLNGTASAADYQLDQGPPFTSILVTSGGYALALNQYTVEAGHTHITQLEFSWDNAQDSMAEVLIWDDPDGDGLPADASVIWSSTIQGVSGGTLGIVQVPVPTVSVGPAGSSFFVGFRTLIAYPPPRAFTQIADDDDVFAPLRGFALTSESGPVDATDLSGVFPIENLFSPSMSPIFVIRANAVATPSTSVLALLAASAGTRRRRR